MKKILILLIALIGIIPNIKARDCYIKVPNWSILGTYIGTKWVKMSEVPQPDDRQLEYLYGYGDWGSNQSKLPWSFISNNDGIDWSYNKNGSNATHVPLSEITWSTIHLNNDGSYNPWYNHGSSIYDWFSNRCWVVYIHPGTLKVALEERCLITSVNDINIPVQPKKVLENGQIVIYDNDNKYNIKGQKIK